MSNKVPQKPYFEEAEKWGKHEYKCKNCAMLLSFFSAIYSLFLKKNMFINMTITIITFLLSFLLFYFQYKFTRTYREAEKIRREGFLDNSFNTKIADTSSDGYYDTDEIEYGIKKLLSNLYENSIYSAKVSSKMINNTEKKIIIFSLIMIVFAILNLFGTQFTVSLVDIFISSNLLKKYLELKSLNENIKNVKDECKRIADSYKPKYHSTDNKTMALILRAYIRYETAMAYASLMLDNNIFNSLNEQLTSEWKELKIRYNL